MSTYKTITDLHAEWQALQPLKPEDEKRLWKKLRLEWNYHSNHIEGNTLTYGETATLLIHNQAVGNHDLRNYVEMKAHDLAIEHLRSLVAEDRGLSEADIRGLNQILLKEPFWKDAITSEGQATRIEILPGKYKRQPNNVRTADGDVFEFVAPVDVPDRMKLLLDFYIKAEAEKDMHPVAIAAKLHHDFVLIHPFGDGNGRTARLLVNYVLMRAGYPPIIVPSPEKDRYLAALRQADAGDIAPLCEYLAVCTERSLIRAIAAGRGESIQEPDDLDKEVAVFVKSQTEGEKKVLEKSKEVLEALADVSIIPLLDLVEEKVRKFEPLFLNTKFAVKPPSPTGNTEILAGFNHFARQNGEGKFSVNIYFSGYKGSAALPFDLHLALTIHVSKYEYEIRFANKQLVRRTYSEPLLMDEITIYASEVQATIFEEIKKQAGVE